MNDKVQDLVKRLEEGVAQFYDTEQWKSMLFVMSRFHKYSWNNQILIWCQMPEATRVAGFHTWKSLGRSVVKGSKAIKILAPIFSKKEKKDDENVEEVTKENEKSIIGFRVVNVFDVSQTDGKPLPEHAEEPDTDSEEGKKLLEALTDIITIPVKYEDIKGGALGYYKPASHDITIQQGMSIDMTAKTLLHEYVHSVLHHKDTDRKEKGRGQKETEAEGTAYVVASYFGLDTPDFSFEYVAGWAHSEGGVEIIKEVGNTIQKASKEIIDKIEKAMKGNDMAVGA